MDEFSLIRQFFSARQNRLEDNGVTLGIGDDAAIINPDPGEQLLITTDTLISGVHFPAQTSARAVGHKALAVNLSDIAAMGGRPRWLTLALSLPSADATWLKMFSDGLFALADQYAVELVGGDTTKGPLSITITVIGSIATDEAIKRSGAQPGDAIFVTGQPGMAALGLADIQGKIKLPDTEQAVYRSKLEYPHPRLSEGQYLQSFVSSMIDISDGLAADLEHILVASGCAAIVNPEILTRGLARATDLPTTFIENAVLHGGDDYELLFTVPDQQLATLKQTWPEELAPLCEIGRITKGTGIRVQNHNGNVSKLTIHGYNHFNE